MPSNPDSILDSVKKVLGLGSDQTEFDLDVTMHTNMALATLTQLGVGPTTGYSINDSTAEWTDFTPQHYLLGPVRTFVYLSVRLIFDPPATSFVIEAIEKQISELGWRINVMAEQPPIPSGVFVANWFDLTGMTDFPSGAVTGDYGYDTSSWDIYVKDHAVADASWWNLTGQTDFPVEAAIGDVGYDTTTGDVWRKTA